MSGGIETLAPQDIGEACALFERVFGHTTDPGRWHWKYALGPRLAGLNLVYRNPQGRLVGHVGASVFEGVAAGRRLPMAQLSDVMVDPAARGTLDPQGVYAQLMRAMQDALQQRFPGVFAYGFVGIRPGRLGVRMGLYKPQHECRNGLLTSAPARTFLDPCREGFLHARPLAWDEALQGPLLDRLWQRASAVQQRPAVARTADYLRWRYAEHPQHRYRLWCLRRWGQAMGWAVTREMPSGQVQLIDQLPLPSDLVALDVAHGSHAGQGGLAGLSVLQALYRGLASSLVSSPASPEVPLVLASWGLDTEAARQQEPVIGVEFKVGAWHQALRSPLFVPGDTDVF